MTNSAVYKGLLLGCLIVGVFAQDVAQDVVQVVAQDVAQVVAQDVAEVSEEARLRELRLLEEKIVQDQAANAVYSFATSIVDGIMDNMQLRSETRNGLSVNGSYSYSDGFFKRTVNYVADEDGYRVVSELVEPLGDGPKVNLNGHADVRTLVDGQELGYSITKADIGRLRDEPAPVAELLKVAEA